jgi:hypothetical protein
LHSSTSLEFCFHTATPELLVTLNRILNLTTVGLLALVSGFNTVGTPANSITAEVSKTDSVLESKTATTEEKVMQYFADKPILIDIARCESRFRHTNKNGTVLRGELTPADVGVMQINERYHLEASKKLGYDIHSLEGNMAYAEYLYDKQGARPWLASSHCWANYSEIAKK